MIPLINDIPIVESYVPNPDAWNKPQPAVICKEAERQKLADDVSVFLQSGQRIRRYKLRTTQVEWYKKRKKRLRARKVLAKLTPEDVKEIREILKIKRCIKWKKGKTYKETFEWLAKQYNTCPGNIQSIWRNDSWKDVQ